MNGVNEVSFKQRNLHKLALFAHQLAQGEQCHITKLMPLCRLVDNNQLGSRFMQYLLRKNAAYLHAGQSLAKQPFLTVEEKLAHYQLLLNPENNSSPEQFLNASTLENVYEICQQYGANKRLNVHATRRTLSDPDLLLLEQFARCHLNSWLARNWIYWYAKTYCCDYENYRYKPNQLSACRVMDIVRFFDE